MIKNVIHIFGASGSGTTTLGRYICEQLGYGHMDSDDYFWMPTDPPYRKKRPKNERVACMRNDVIRMENVVITGSLTDWGDPLIPYFTLAVRLITPTDVRIARIRERERHRFGARIEFGGDMYDEHQKFLRWASEYDDGGLDMRSSAKHDEWQKLLACKLIMLRGDAPPGENLTAIRAYLQD